MPTQRTYNEGIVEGSIDAGNSEDELVGEDVLGTEGDDLLSLGGLGGGLRFSLASLYIDNKCNVSMMMGGRRIYLRVQERIHNRIDFVSRLLRSIPLP